MRRETWRTRDIRSTGSRRWSSLGTAASRRRAPRARRRHGARLLGGRPGACGRCREGEITNGTGFEPVGLASFSMTWCRTGRPAGRCSRAPWAHLSLPSSAARRHFEARRRGRACAPGLPFHSHISGRQGDRPAGLHWQLVSAWGDPVVAGGPEFRNDASQRAADQALQAGMGHDGMDFFPLPLGSRSSGHGLLAVNYEYIDDRLLPKTAGKLVGGEGPEIEERPWDRDYRGPPRWRKMERGKGLGVRPAHHRGHAVFHQGTGGGPSAHATRFDPTGRMALGHGTTAPMASHHGGPTCRAKRT